MLTHFDDCAGIGGFSLAAEWCGGIATIAAREIDPYARRVYALRFPHVRLYEDCRGPVPDESPDLYVAGFPCQPFSVAGKRRGADDERNLWLEIKRSISVLRPAWVLLENVPEIGPYVQSVIGPDLVSLGYEWLPLGIPACVVGAAQLRQRLWIVAHLAGEQMGPSRQSRFNESMVADVESAGFLREKQQKNGSGGARGESADDPDSVSALADDSWGQGEQASWCSWWSVEPELVRVVHGVPHRVDRLRCLGNAIVPQVACWIMRRIVEVEFAQR